MKNKITIGFQIIKYEFAVGLPPLLLFNTTLGNFENKNSKYHQQANNRKGEPVKRYRGEDYQAPVR